MEEVFRGGPTLLLQLLSACVVQRFAGVTAACEQPRPACGNFQEIPQWCHSQDKVISGGLFRNARKDPTNVSHLLEVIWLVTHQQALMLFRGENSLIALSTLLTLTFHSGYYVRRQSLWEQDWRYCFDSSSCPANAPVNAAEELKSPSEITRSNVCWWRRHGRRSKPHCRFESLQCGLPWMIHTWVLLNKSLSLLSWFVWRCPLLEAKIKDTPLKSSSRAVCSRCQWDLNIILLMRAHCILECRWGSWKSSLRMIQAQTWTSNNIWTDMTLSKRCTLTLFNSLFKPFVFEKTTVVH